MSVNEKAGEQQKIRDQVRTGYARIAEEEGSSCCGPTSCCGSDSSEEAKQLAQEIGYELEELEALPEGANMGLSCGNPIAVASLEPGDVVADLGCGGGFDVFLAGRRVGDSGRAIGIDMTAEMLSKARANTASYRESTGLNNVEFRLGEIEHLPLADQSVDVVISNCVLNLSPDKKQVWRDVARVLKPGGRVSISDMALKKKLPESVASKAESLIGCVSGAIMVEETRRMAEQAGLTDIALEEKSDYVDSLSKWNDPLYLEIKRALPESEKLGDYIVSLSVRAKKPGGCCCGS